MPGTHSSTGCYERTTLALLTQHGKERVLGPVLDEAFGARVEVVDEFDTDTLGTFTREIPRIGTQLEAAREKARIGLKLSGLPLALASEGSFSPGPFGLGSRNVELVLLSDQVRNIEIVGTACEAGRHAHATVRTRAELAEFAKRAGFPEHGIALRPDHMDDPRVRKEVRSWSELEEQFRLLQAASSTGSVFAENDLRAHRNPTRMNTIEAAAQDLVQRMSTRCLTCDSPGFGLVTRQSGLPCAECGHPTEQAQAEVFGCVVCEFRQVRNIPSPQYADPGNCQECNP